MILLHICHVIQHGNYMINHTRMILYDCSNDFTKYFISNELSRHELNGLKNQHT